MSIQNFSFHLPSIPKLICSLPVLLVALYFVPPLGIVLTIARLFIYGSYRYYRVPAAILIVALLCLVPRGYELLQQNFGEQVPVFQPLIDFRGHSMFAKLTDFGRFTAIFSIIMLVASQILGKVANMASQALRMAQATNSDTSSAQKSNRKVMQKENNRNDPSDQETPHVVKCPNCGKANHITGTVGDCKACRSALEWHPKK
jgi:hypothetical protein